MSMQSRPSTYANRSLPALAAGAMVVAGALVSAAIAQRPLLAAAVLVGIFCAVVYFRPVWGLYVVVALIPFQIFPMAFFGSEYTWSVAQLLVKFLFVVTVLRIMQSGRLQFAYSPLNLWIMLFMLVPVLSTVNAPDLREHIKGTIPAVIDLFLLYFVVLNNVNTRRQLRILVGVLLGTTLVVAGVGTLQYLLGAGTVQTYLFSHIAALFVGPGYAELRSPLMLGQIEGGQFRSVPSIFVNPSDYGGFLLYSFPLALALFLLGDNPKSRVVHAALALLFGLNILVSLARSAWLGLAAALLLVLVVAAKRKPRVIVALIVLGVTMLGLASVAGVPDSSLLPETVLERTVATMSQGPLSASWQTRVGWWEDVLTAVSRSPLVGTGALFKTHSQYFGLLLLFGASGLGLHLIILGLAAHLLLTAHRASTDGYLRAVSLGACASLVAVSVHSLLWNDLFFVPAADMLFALFLGLAAVLPPLCRLHEPSLSARSLAKRNPNPSKRAAGALMVGGALASSVSVVRMDFSPFDLLSYGSLVVIPAFVVTSLVGWARRPTVHQGDAAAAPPRCGAR